MALQPVAPVLLWAACDAWLRRSEQVISASAEALNVLNVFPVSDADTGSNLMLTLRGIAEAVPDFNRDSLDSVVQAAILSAHGNSGAILAEMVTSVCRALERDPGNASSLPAGTLVARLMRQVAIAATQAVARPVAGTILTVADQAAEAAEAAALDDSVDALGVAHAAQLGAREALSRTPEQLDVLAKAGVVDAGGQAYVLLVDVLVEVLGGQPAEPLTHVMAPSVMSRDIHPMTRGATEYEVMYAIRGARKSSLDGLRDQLSGVGNSVVIVGDQTIAQVHVHLDEPGAAVEAGLILGRLSQIKITALEPAATTDARVVLSMVVGPGLAAAVDDMGGVALQASRGQLTLDELSASLSQACGDVVILPNDMENLEIANHLASMLRTKGRRIAVIPTVAQVQGLAAIAVHEPTADFETAVVAMSTAAGHTRQGGVTIAEGAAMTMAGRCQAGDVLGVVEGDFVEIGTSVTEVGWRVIQRLLAAGGELLTLVSGVDADAGLIEELERRTIVASRGVEVEKIVGGQDRYLMLIGLE